MQKQLSPLRKLYSRQQPKVKYTMRKANLLKTYAGHDYVAIAQLLQCWIQEDRE